MNIQIRSLRIKDCGPFRDVCINFCDSAGVPFPLTVLGGANGSGKTTTLEVIVAMAELFDSIPSPQVSKSGRNYLNRTGLAEIGLRLDGGDIQLSYSAVEPPYQPPHGVVWPAGKASPDNAVGTTHNIPDRTKSFYPDKFDKDILSYRHSGNSYLEIASELEGKIHHSKDRVIEFPNETSNEALPPSVLYFPHSRSIMPLEGEHIQREETKYQWVYRYENVRSFEGSLDSYLIWLDYAEPEVFVRVIEFLNGLDFDGKKFSVNRRELKVVVTTKDRQTHFLENLSSGEQNILIMLLELRRRLIPGSIVLIDEIENSLHPAYQYRLALALKKMRETIPFQLIVATHAEPFPEIFGWGSTLILTNYGGK